MNLDSQQITALVIFLGGSLAVIFASLGHSYIFITGAKKDPASSVKEAGITLVSGHFLAFFVLPLSIIVGATLAILGRLDTGVTAIIVTVITYIVQKVVIR